MFLYLLQVKLTPVAREIPTTYHNYVHCYQTARRRKTNRIRIHEYCVRRVKGRPNRTRHSDISICAHSYRAIDDAFQPVVTIRTLRMHRSCGCTHHCRETPRVYLYTFHGIKATSAVRVVKAILYTARQY